MRIAQVSIRAKLHKNPLKTIAKKRIYIYVTHENLDFYLHLQKWGITRTNSQKKSSFSRVEFDGL